MCQTRQADAAEASTVLFNALPLLDTGNFNTEAQENLVNIIQAAQEHCKHISTPSIATQRLHFEALSQRMIELIAITGTPKTLYQQYCPMYNQNEGGTWLSDSQSIRNPLFGSEMLACGRVQREIK